MEGVGVNERGCITRNGDMAAPEQKIAAPQIKKGANLRLWILKTYVEPTNKAVEAAAQRWAQKHGAQVTVDGLGLILGHGMSRFDQRPGHPNSVGPDKRPRWTKEGGTRRVFTRGQLWWSRHDPDFKELLDTRGKNDVESALGEWTKVECICKGSRITVRVNGTTINECYDAFPSAGKILLQSEGFELFFRKVELHPLKKS